ncbi:hypothetical protein PFISCL1PPCAC_3068, partial [Pristionchus fissidentatus]
ISGRFEYGYGDEMRNARFRGGGTGNYSKQEKPSVDEFTVIDSLFASKHFSSIFDDQVDKSPIREANMSQGSIEIITFKTPLTVRASKSPFMVNQSIAYFWGPEFLPDNITDDCVNITSSNGGTYLSFCNMTQHDRCSRNITEIERLFNYKFMNATGNIFTKFAWTCPKDLRCCNWECCEPFKMHWVTAIAISIILSILLLGLVCICCMGLIGCCGCMYNRLV